MDTDHAMPGVSPVKPAMTAGGLCATEATETEATAKRAKNLAVHAPVARFEMKPMRYSRMVLGSLLYASTPVSALEPARGLDQIETIVVIYAENRGFDHLYGLFPGANGLRNVTPEMAAQRDRDEGILTAAQGRPLGTGLARADNHRLALRQARLRRPHAL